MWQWLKSAVGRKLASLIITPIIISLFTFINQFLPVGSQFTPEQMTAIIERILEALMVFIAGQSVADTVNGSPGRPKVIPVDTSPVSANIVPNNGAPSTEQ
jgi:hypothetical protein